ncbi:MAG: hypothetical protein SGBAC_007849 [Bacillariaceae sp.]
MSSSSTSADVNAAALGYAVKQLHVGIVSDGEDDTRRTVVAKKLRRLFPDRICTHQLSLGSPFPKDMALLIMCCSLVGLSKETSEWIQSSLEKLKEAEAQVQAEEEDKYIQQAGDDTNTDVLVWTDYDLDRNLQDRQHFYNILVVNELTEWVPHRVLLLPPEVDVFGRKLVETATPGVPEAAATNNGSNLITINTSAPLTSPAGNNHTGGIIASPTASSSSLIHNKLFVDRRDQLEINGVILLKPVLRRPIDPNDQTVTIFYPRSQGGGAKTLQFLEDKELNVPNFRAHFDPNVRHVPQDTSQVFLYEELHLPPQIDDKEGVVSTKPGSIAEVVTRQKERKRDRFRKFMKKLSGESEVAIQFGDDEQVSYDSDLTRLDRKIFVVTTAALPWMTGTAVNPLLRVAYLKRGRPKNSVTLVIPWLSRENDRLKVYGSKHTFNNEKEQEEHVRDWLRNQAGMPEEADPENGVQIMWYPSRYYAALGSIFPTGDICSQIPKEDADFCILEEPEHLNWIRAAEEEGEIWTDKFNHVVGVIHTNYKAYASATAAIAAPVISGLSSLMVRAYCDKVIKLSATLQAYSQEKEVVCNVHGVRSDFLDIGARRALEQPKTPTNTNIAVDATGAGDEKPVAYFIGKLLWEKGLDRLLRLQYFYKEITGEFFPIDIVGDGPDRTEIEATYLGLDVRSIRKVLASSDEVKFSWGAVTEQLGSVLEVPTSLQLQTGKVPGQFHGRQDHANFCAEYKVIVNPSVTEVLCTTTAEALSMGKFAIIPKHPSNDFFLQFPNCLAYENKVDFVTKLVHALTRDPTPLTEDLSYIFTWEAATERLIVNSAITMKEARMRAKARKGHEDDRIAKMYNKLGIRGHGWGSLFGNPPSPERETTKSESSEKEVNVEAENEEKGAESASAKAADEK